MSKDDKGLVPSFGKSLYHCVSGSIEDTADYALDRLAEELLTGSLEKFIPVIQDVPIVGYFVSAGKVVATVRDQLFLRKTLQFFSELHRGKVNEEEIAKRQLALQNKQKWVYDELEMIITTIEQLDRIEKTKILAEIYRSYLNKEIERDMFDDLFGVTDKLFLGDMIQLRADYHSKKEREKQSRGEMAVCSTIRYLDITGRLLALGLMRISVELTGNTRTNVNILQYTPTKRGEIYAEILNRIDFLGIKDGPKGE